MKKLIVTSVFSLLIVGCDITEQESWPSGDFKTTTIELGQHLYLDHGIGIITHRAKFNYAKDCNLIRGMLQQREPNVFWSCAGKAE